MTKIKLCGLSRRCDIEAANALMPDYVGFVFAEGSKRRVTPAQAQALKNALSPQILAVGVFVDEAPTTVAALRALGADAVLIGETLMRAPDKRAKLAELRGGVA